MCSFIVALSKAAVPRGRNWLQCHTVSEILRVLGKRTQSMTQLHSQSRQSDPNQSLTPLTATLVNCDFYLFIHWNKLLSLHGGGLAGSLQLGMEEEEVISERGASSKGFTYGASGDRNAWEQYEEASVCAGSNWRRRLVLVVWCHEATDTIEQRHKGLVGEIWGWQDIIQAFFLWILWGYYDLLWLHLEHGHCNGMEKSWFSHF